MSEPVVVESPKQAFSWRDPHPMFVIVLVGPEEMPFGLHKDFICSKSTYFSNHFASLSEDQLEHIVKLPSADPEVFGLAQNYLYTNSVFESSSEQPPGYDKFIALYSLGSTLEINGLCEEVLVAMQECRRLTQRIPATPLLVQVWEDTPDGSPLRKLLLRWAAEYVRSSDAREEFTKSLPHNVLSDLVVVMSNPDFSSSSQPENREDEMHQGSSDHEAGDDGNNVNQAAWKGSKTSKHRHADAGHHAGAGSGQKNATARKHSRTSLPSLPKPLKKQRVSLHVAPDRPFTEEQKLVFCADLIGRMLSGPGYWTRLVGPFKDPVNPLTDGVPDYLEKITKPMDLTTIKSKMDRKEYATAGEFAADVRQICLNCYAYHTKGNPTWEACTKFEDHFEKIFATMEKWLVKMGGEEPA